MALNWRMMTRYFIPATPYLVGRRVNLDEEARAAAKCNQRTTAFVANPRGPPQVRVQQNRRRGSARRPGEQSFPSELKASLGWLNIQPLPLTNVTDSSSLAYDQSLSTGTGAGEADQIWGYSHYTLGASVTLNLVLSALDETVFGSNVQLNMKKIKAILLLNLSTTRRRVEAAFNASNSHSTSRSTWPGVAGGQRHRGQ